MYHNKLIIYNMLQQIQIHGILYN